MEMSFITPENIYNVIEGIIKNVWKKSLKIDLEPQFKRMRFDEV
jgi:aspartyl-tRNA synthetase